jgi:hypothetical protein
VVWILSKRRNFEVKTFYKALVCHEAASFPWKGRVYGVLKLRSGWRSLFGQRL